MFKLPKVVGYNGGYSRLRMDERYYVFEYRSKEKIEIYFYEQQKIAQGRIEAVEHRIKMNESLEAKL